MIIYPMHIWISVKNSTFRDIVRPKYGIWRVLILMPLVSKLEALRSSAASEFELRGPFPQTEYSRILESTNKMLDAFHSMNVAIQKDLKASEGEAAILKYTIEERTQLSARISHLFQGKTIIHLLSTIILIFSIVIA